MISLPGAEVLFYISGINLSQLLKPAANKGGGGGLHENSSGTVPKWAIDSFWPAVFHHEKFGGVAVVNCEYPGWQLGGTTGMVWHSGPSYQRRVYVVFHHESPRGSLTNLTIPPPQDVQLSIEYIILQETTYSRLPSNDRTNRRCLAITRKLFLGIRSIKMPFVWYAISSKHVFRICNCVCALGVKTQGKNPESFTRSW